MADEYSKPPYNGKMHILQEYNWQSLTSLRGTELQVHYSILLRELGKEKGMRGQIFTKSQNKIQDPAKLYKLVDLINKENLVMMGVDVKGNIYESLLEKNAEDTKSGAEAVLYVTCDHKGNGRVCSSQINAYHCRPRMWYGRFLFGGVRFYC